MTTTIEIVEEAVTVEVVEDGGTTPTVTDAKIAAHDTSGSAHSDIRALIAGSATLAGQTDVTITAVGADEVLGHNGSNWLNRTLAEAGIAPIASPVFTGTPTLPGASVTADLTLENNVAINVKNTGGTSRELLTLNGSDVIKLGSTAEGPLLLDSSSYVQVRTAANPGLIVNSDQTARMYSHLTVDGTLTVGSGTPNNYYRIATGGEIQERSPAQVLSDIGAAASSHEHTESDITDLGAYITDVTGDPLDDLSNVTITANSSGEVLKWNGSAWVNNTLAEADIAAASALSSYAPLASPTFTGTVNLAAMIASASVVSPVFAPASDSTTAVKITKADKTTAVLTVDTTNSRLTVPGNITSTSGTVTANNATLDAGNLKLKSSVTDAVTKTAFIRLLSYDTSNGDVVAMYGVAGVAANNFTFGGGGGGLKAATRVSFNTAANVTTNVGTERMRIDSVGKVTMYGDAQIDGDVDLDGIPTSDPAHAGRLWNDSGTLKISAG